MSAKEKLFKCAICKVERQKKDMLKPPASFRYVCSVHSNPECIVLLSKQLLEKKKEKEFKAKKKTYKENKIATRKRAAKEACHEYIRERDKYDTCICCGRPLGDDYHAGHFLESGNYSSIRYDEDNIHGQRQDCNIHKGGNSGEYEIRLREKIGDKRVESLHKKKHENKRYTVQEYRDIELYYKQKLKDLISLRSENAHN